MVCTNDELCGSYLHRIERNYNNEDKEHHSATTSTERSQNCRLEEMEVGLEMEVSTQNFRSNKCIRH